MAVTATGKLHYCSGKSKVAYDTFIDSWWSLIAESEFVVTICILRKRCHTRLHTCAHTADDSEFMDKP